MIRIRFVTIIPVLIILFCFSACNQNNDFIVSGRFQQAEATPVELFLLLEDNSERIDSVFTQDGFFSLSGNADYPSIYLLRFFNDQSIYLVIYPNDKINLTIDNSMPEIAYYVENSPDSKYIKELTDQQNIVLKQIDQLSMEWENNRIDSLLRKKIDSTYFSLLKGHQNYTRNFIYEHPKSLANILALYQNFGKKGAPLFDKYEDIDIFNFVDSLLTQEYPLTEAVIALNRSISETKDQIKQNTLIEKRVEIGLPLPQVSIKSIDNDSLTIGANNNNASLIIFWASWNKFSVEELLAIQKFYNSSNVKSKIDLITISLDSSEEQLRECISENGVSLPVVCEYMYWDSRLAARYVVKRIPTVIFADNKGKVIARDILSDELFIRINETIK